VIYIQVHGILTAMCLLFLTCANCFKCLWFWTAYKLCI